ncbi:MAG: redoxin domain-containing protein [Thermomicrobiales bacterium]
MARQNALSSKTMSTPRKSPRSWTGKPAAGTESNTPGAAPGTFLSDFALPDLNGNIVRVSDQVGHAYLLLFVAPDCKPSQAVLRELSRLLREKNGASLPVIVTISGGELAARSIAAQYALGNGVVAQEDQELLSFYRVPATPAAYHIDETRRTVGPLAIGSHEVIGVLRGKATSVQTAKKQGRQKDSTSVIKRGKVRLAAGSPIPNAALAAPQGFSIDLYAHVGKRLLVLFWSEHCPFCEEVVASAKGLLERASSPNLIIIGRDGDKPPDDLADAVFGTQDRRTAARDFGLLQTPAAVLVDAAGRLEQAPAEGSAAVLELLRTL